MLGTVKSRNILHRPVYLSSDTRLSECYMFNEISYWYGIQVESNLLSSIICIRLENII